VTVRKLLSVFNPRFRVWARDIGISVIASLIIVHRPLPAVRVEGTSMQPGLRDQDRLFIDKFFFRFEKSSAATSSSSTTHAIPKRLHQRIIALPGDSIFIDHGRVWVNDQPLDEPYVPIAISTRAPCPKFSFPPATTSSWATIAPFPATRATSGPVDRDLIYGKATFIYWPADNMASFARQRQAAVYNPIPPLLKKNPPLTHP